MKLTNKKGRGQKSKLTAGDKAQIMALMKGKVGRSHRKVSKLLNNSDRNKQRGFTVSPSTIVHYVRKTPWGKKSFKVKRYPLLKAEQKAKRKDVCCQWIRDKFCDDTPASKKKREHVIWTDESWIELFPQPNKQNERVRVEDIEDVPTRRVVKMAGKVMVAGAMTANGLSKLHFVPADTTVTGQYYRDEILEKVYYPCLEDKNMCPDRNRVTFMQDGATPHTANLSQQWCCQHFPNFWTKEQWPGNSPDLNPIEKLWAILNNKFMNHPIAQH